MGIVVDLARAAIGGRKANEKAVPASASMAPTESGRQGKANVRLYRHWSEHSELVRGAIDIRRGQLAVAEWDILPVDPDKPWSTPLKNQLIDLFSSPNPQRDSWRSFIEPVVEDVLVLDAGSIEKVRNLRGQIANLYYVDGGEVKVAKYWDGEEDENRYFWYPDGQVRARWKNADFTYIMARPATYRVVGLSTMEVLKSTIDRELGADAYNSRQVTSAAPDGLLDLGEGVRPDQVDKFRSYWLAEIAGRGAMAIVGGSRNAKFHQFRMSNRDMQFSEWQNYLLRKTALVFQLTPQDLNAVTDVNRASAGVFQENTEDRGLRPLLGLHADYLTREIVWDEGFGGKANNLRFAFTRLNQRESLDAAKVEAIQTGNMPTRAVNELRKKAGEEPWDAIFDLPMVVTPTGVVVLGPDTPTAREVMESKKKPEPKPPAPPAKAADINVAAADLSPIRDLFERFSGDQEKLIEAIALRGAPPEVNINEGAVQVSVSSPVSFEQTVPTDVVRETEFVMDEAGRVIGKRETEAKTPIEPLTLETKLRTDKVRETEFVMDSTGRITGKREVERDADQ